MRSDIVAIKSISGRYYWDLFELNLSLKSEEYRLRRRRQLLKKMRPGTMWRLHDDDLLAFLLILEKGFALECLRCKLYRTVLNGYRFVHHKRKKYAKIEVINDTPMRFTDDHIPKCPAVERAPIDTAIAVLNARGLALGLERFNVPDLPVEFYERLHDREQRRKDRIREYEHIFAGC